MRNVLKWGLLFCCAVFAVAFIGDIASAQHAVTSLANISGPTFGHGLGISALAFMGRTMVAPGMAKAPQRYPFEFGTRRRFQHVGSYTFTPGTPVPSITLPQVGYLSRIFLRIEGTITQTAAGATLSPLGLASLISRVRVNANLGSASIVDCTGVGLELANYWYNPQSGPVKATYGNAIAANRVKYGTIIPINANDRQLLQLGLINLQAEQTRINVDIIPAAVTAYLTAGGGTITPALTLYVGYEYWDVPNPQRFVQPPVSIVRTLEDTVQITNTGEQIYQLPRLGTLAQMSEYFVLAGALAQLDIASPEITNFKLRANKTDTWLDYDTKYAEMDESLLYATASGGFMRPGVKTWDFFHSGEQAFNMGDRDMVNTEQMTTLESIATVLSTVVPGTTSYRGIVRRVIQRAA